MNCRMQGAIECHEEARPARSGFFYAWLRSVRRVASLAAIAWRSRLLLGFDNDAVDGGLGRLILPHEPLECGLGLWRQCYGDAFGPVIAKCRGSGSVAKPRGNLSIGLFADPGGLAGTKLAASVSVCNGVSSFQAIGEKAPGDTRRQSFEPLAAMRVLLLPMSDPGAYRLGGQPELLADGFLAHALRR
ncbi:hypothetical protein DFO67_11462 [Modicisalibacter xianhensis]|uniref:Uncharacterized protein n=1 Tax=Modicisalibacter xianhensis TaxID=442341 RepID=A0A4R8FS85_9GAMM|nr:hypothetical protein DFO67_11462 [Halomonas xianhensis]